jgi:hypothetical protein
MWGVYFFFSIMYRFAIPIIMATITATVSIVMSVVVGAAGAAGAAVTAMLVSAKDA